jgi:hypothetical protein
MNAGGIDIEKSVEKVNDALKPIVCILIAVILIIVIVMVYHHFKVHHPKLPLAAANTAETPKNEAFARLVNQRMIMNGEDPSVHYRKAPRGDRIGQTYWSRFKTNEDRTGKVLKVFNDQYKKKFGVDSCEFIVKRIAGVMADKEITEVINKQTQKVEDVVVTEKGSDVIDTKFEVTEDKKIIATEPIIEPTTHQVIAKPSEIVAEVPKEVEVPAPAPENHVAPAEVATTPAPETQVIKPVEHVETTVAEVIPESTQAPVVPAPEVDPNEQLIEPPKAEEVAKPMAVELPEGAEETIVPPTIDTTGMIHDNGNVVTETAEVAAVAKEQWTPVRGLNTKSFQQLSWGSAQLNSNAFSINTPKPTLSLEAYGRLDYQKKKFLN